MKNRVYELRKKKNMTLKQLSEKAGIGMTTINDFEKDRTSPTLETITRLADALDVSVDELFEEKKPKSITLKKSDYPDKTKEEYIADLQEIFSGIETYKVRYFYIFTLAKLGIQPKGGAAV